MEQQPDEPLNRIEINSYGEFYNVPRQIRVNFNGQWYYLSSGFDDTIDDYADFYDVYILPFSEEEMKGYYWTKLTDNDYIGRITIADLGLDSSKRKSIDGKAFAHMVKKVDRSRK